MLSRMPSRIVPVLFSTPEDEAGPPKSVLKRKGLGLGFLTVRVSGLLLDGDVSKDLTAALSALPFHEEREEKESKEEEEESKDVEITGRGLKPLPDLDVQVDHALNRLFVKGVRIGGQEEVDYTAILEPLMDVRLNIFYYLRDHGTCVSLDMYIRSSTSSPFASSFSQTSEPTDTFPTVLEFRDTSVVQFYDTDDKFGEVSSFRSALHARKNKEEVVPSGSCARIRSKVLTRSKKLRPGSTPNPKDGPSQGRPDRAGKKRRSRLHFNHPYIYQADTFDEEEAEEEARLFLQWRGDQDERHFKKISTDIHTLMEEETPSTSVNAITRADRFRFNWTRNRHSIGLTREEEYLAKMMRLETLFDRYRLVYIFTTWYLDPAKPTKSKKNALGDTLDKSAKEVHLSFYRLFQKWILSPVEESRSLAVLALESIIVLSQEFVESGTKEWLSFVWENDSSFQHEWNNYVLEHPFFQSCTEDELFMWKVDFTECKLNSKRYKPSSTAPYLELIGKGEDRCVFDTMRVAEVTPFYSRSHRFQGEKTTFVSAFQNFWMYPQTEWPRLRQLWADTIRKCRDIGIISLCTNANLLQNPEQVSHQLNKLASIELPPLARALPKHPGDPMPSAFHSAIERRGDTKKGCFSPHCKEHNARLMLQLVHQGEFEMVQRLVAEGAGVNTKACIGQAEVATARWMFIDFEVQEDGKEPVAKRSFQQVADNTGGVLSVFKDSKDKPISDPVDVEVNFKFGMVTPLAAACYLGNVEMVRFFLDKGANPMLHDAVAIRYCLPGVKEVARQWKSGKKDKESKPALECFMAVFGWYTKNLKRYPIATKLRQAFFKQTLLIEALLHDEEETVDFLMNAQASTQKANENRIAILEVIDQLLDEGKTMPRGTHANIVRSLHTLISRAKFSVDHFRMQRICLLLESAVRNNLAGNEEAVMDMLMHNLQLRKALKLELTEEELKDCVPVIDLLRKDDLPKSTKGRLFPRKRRPVLSKLYLQCKFIGNLFDIAFKSRMYQLMQLMLDNFDLPFDALLEPMVYTSVKTLDTTTLSMLTRFFKKGGKNMPESYALLLARAWLKTLQESIEDMEDIVYARLQSWEDKYMKFYTMPALLPQDNAPIIAYVINELVEHEQDELIQLSPTLLKWMQFAMVATPLDPEMEEDSKNQPLDEAFAYTVSKLRADDCTALLKLLIEVCAMVNKLSVSRVKCFIDHCLQIDDTLITKEIFLALVDALDGGVLYASPSIAADISNHLKENLKGKLDEEVIAHRVGRSGFI